MCYYYTACGDIEFLILCHYMCRLVGHQMMLLTWLLWIQGKTPVARLCTRSTVLCRGTLVVLSVSDSHHIQHGFMLVLLIHPIKLSHQ